MTRRRRSARRAVSCLAVVTVLGALAACDDSTAGANWVGAKPSVVAEVAGCTGGTQETQAPADAPVQFQSIICVVDGKPVAIQTYASPDEQAKAESQALPALGQSLPKGRYYYASGNGWLAEDAEKYTEAIAKAIVAKLGGEIRYFEGQMG